MASARDSIADIWGPRTPVPNGRWPVRVDQILDEDPDRRVQGCCFLCSNGCGIDVGVKDDTPGGRIVGVRGPAADVVGRGRLGPKGLHGWVATASPDRPWSMVNESTVSAAVLLQGARALADREGPTPGGRVGGP